MTHILLTGGRSPATLELLRHLSSGGARVFVAESDPYNLAGASRFCQESFLVPPPRQQTQAFIEKIRELIQTHKINLLIPTCEETYYISKWKPYLSQYCEVFTDSIDVLTNLHSKYQFMQLLQALQIKHPTSLQVTSQDQLRGFLADWHQFVLKPEFSRFSNYVIINAPTNEVLNRVFPSESDPWVLQEYLEGPQFCSYSIARHGRLLAHSVYPSTYCAGRGATVYFESCPVPEIELIVKRVVKSLNYTGQIAFDFIQTKDGYVPIECNPRATTGTYLFANEDNLTQAFTQSHIPTIYPGKKKAQMVTIAMLSYVLPQIKDFKSLKQFMRSLFSAQDTTFRLSDLTPFFQQFPMIWRYTQKARKYKMTFIEASTLDIEWNGHWEKENETH